MAFFSAWDYKHYSLVHAQLESICYGKLVHLMENGELPASGKPSHQEEEEACGMKPKFSRLSKQEHKMYLKLLQKYNNKVLTSPTPEERKDIETLASLQRKVVEEQKEFTAIFHTLPEVHERYKTLGSQACRFVQEHLEASLRRTLCYPRHYKEHCTIRLTDAAVIPQFEANVLQMGRCARLVRPNLNNHCQVNLDYDKLMGRFPPLDIDSRFHPSVGPTSRDDLGLKLALKHGAGVLLELDVLAILLNCHTAESQWDLPVVVRKDKTTEQTVVCADEPVLPELLSRRDKNQMCYDYAARLRLTHVNVGRGREKRDGTARLARPRGRPRKTESPRKEAPVAQDDDMFGDAEDPETFGTVVERKTETCAGSRANEKIPLREACEDDSTSNKSDPVAELDGPESQRKNTEATEDDRLERSPGKNRRSPSSGSTLPELEGTASCASSGPATDSVCTCSARVVTRRTKQQCALCRTKNDNVATQEQADETCVDSEDELLVIDEEAIHKESLVAEIASPDGTPERGGEAAGSKPGTPRIKLGEADYVKGGGSQEDDEEMVEVSQVGINKAGLEQEGSALDVHGGEDVEAAVRGEERPETDSPESPTPDETYVKKDDDHGDQNRAGMEGAVDALKSPGNVEALPGILLDVDEGDGAGGCTPLPEAENVFYNVWMLGSVRVLLRHRAHALAAATKQTWSIFPKLEYNAHFGAETFTEAELVRQMCYLIMIPNGHLLRVRIDALSSGILCMEELGCTEFVGLAKNLSPDKLFGRAAYILEQLCALQPGYYILSHDCSEDTVKVLRCTEENKRGTFDLHCTANRRAASAEDADGPATIVPLDPEVILPNAYTSGQIPLTFPPKDPKRPVLLVPNKHAKRFKGRKSQQNAKEWKPSDSVVNDAPS